jgi:hypothetical protein
MANESNLKPFVKGDMRINRKGRPKDFAKLRALAVDMASQPALDKNGNPILIHGKPVTNAQLVLYQWLTDKKHQKDFIEVAFGKVPQAVELTGNEGGAIQIEYVNNPYPVTDVSPESSGDTPESK